MTESAPTIPATDEPDHYFDLAAAERAAWAALAEGVHGRRHAFHQATVATVDGEGMPQARIVVLRGADPAARTVRFHTDARSGKIAELAAAPACSVVLYDHDAKIQVRIFGKAEIHHRDAFAQSLWADMRGFSKACYRQPFGPGTPVASPETVSDADMLDDDGGFANFVAVTVAVNGFEWLYLAAKGHRRVRIDYRVDGGREWLAP